MRRMVKEVFLGVRFLVSLYFVLISLSMDTPQKSTLVVLTALYFSFSLLSYIKYEKTRFINKLVDVIFIPPMVFLTGEPKAIYSLLPLIVLHTNRSLLATSLLFFSGVVLTAYMLPKEPLWLFSSLILLISSVVSALIPDFLNVIKKERDSVKNLRSSYRKLLQEFARWEKDKKELEALKFLIEYSTKSKSVEDFLRSVKEKFKVKQIHLIPKKEVESYTPLMDREKGLLSVPVKLEEGNAVVIFEMESPFQLNDDTVVSLLERAGRMVSLYIAGFEDNSSFGRAINIS
ncbi:hypothetical protein BCF55_0099 [Hydrogenivirga caldilitoris]|uniref:Uncharacterized protein n=1 Tax=Hydrogenivirga caldilitoris TaxID=246264 RepID=A0A497XRT1_9AQUI|nr:hypothetical protein [Hydrogenivirga caldilitoris]RLJ69842.1 hypothetical protein BCF55_0099 [Hydrogenivirga caldilitoris]